VFGQTRVDVLLKVGRHAGEGVVELGAEAVDRGDDGDRDAGGDQPLKGGVPDRLDSTKGRYLLCLNARSEAAAGLQ
jgi:hypothetical protein